MSLAAAAILGIELAIHKDSATIDSSAKVSNLNGVLDMTLHHANWCDVFPECVVWFHSMWFSV
jgi:hypothetical protein